MKAALIPALFMSLAVLVGNIIYDKKNKAPINWLRAGASAGIVFIMVMAIGFALE